MASVYSGAPSYGHLCNTVTSLLQVYVDCGLWLRYGSVIIWYLSKPEFTKSETTPTEPNSNNWVNNYCLNEHEA